MIHDPELLERLSTFPCERVACDVFRPTRVGLDPLAPSRNGGRWAPVGTAIHQVPVLYTSLVREGALAELAHHWGQLQPRPSKSALVHRIALSTERTIRLTSADLQQLGLNMDQFGGPDVRRSQEIGAACAFLGCDGLIVPSARWNCENLIVFAENHHLDNELAVQGTEEVNWLQWAYEVGILSDK